MGIALASICAWILGRNPKLSLEHWAHSRTKLRDPSFLRGRRTLRRSQAHHIHELTTGKSRGRFGIVCWQIHRLVIATELPDCTARCAGYVVIGADAVYSTRQHQMFIIRSVAC